MLSPKSAESQGKEFGQHPVGTGPLKLESWDYGSSLVMTRFDDYWGEKATVDSITFRIVPEDASRVMMLKTGDADLVAGIPPVQIDHGGRPDRRSDDLERSRRARESSQGCEDCKRRLRDAVSSFTIDPKEGCRNGNPLVECNGPRLFRGRLRNVMARRLNGYGKIEKVERCCTYEFSVLFNQWH